MGSPRVLASTKTLSRFIMLGSLRAIGFFFAPAPRALRHGGPPPVAQRAGFERRRQSKLPFVEMRHQRQQPISKFCCLGHPETIEEKDKLFKLFCVGSLASLSLR